MKWTFVQINHINDVVGWQVPDILRNGDIRYFEDAMTAWQFAEYKCAQYNKHHPDCKKVPALNSRLHFQKQAEVEIGSKARERLGLRSQVVHVPIRNIFVLPNPSNAGFQQHTTRAFGQIVSNGETQSVMNREPFSGLTPPATMRWTNFSVVEMKKAFGFPANTFFPVQEREGFLAQTLPTPTTSLDGGKELPASGKIDLDGRKLDWSSLGSDISSMLTEMALHNIRPQELNINEIVRPLGLDSSYFRYGEGLVSSPPEQHPIRTSFQRYNVPDEMNVVTGRWDGNVLPPAPEPEPERTNVIRFGEIDGWCLRFGRLHGRPAEYGRDYTSRADLFGYKAIGEFALPENEE